jgi:3-oxoacyl-[acyl-carrier-protein] synthase II
VHALQNEQVALASATGGREPTAWSRPFDQDRCGMVLGEGAAVFILEELGHAVGRGARIHAEIVGHGARTSAVVNGAAGRRRALALAMRQALERAGIDAAQLGHVHAQGLSTVAGDRDEAAAIGDALGAAANAVPTVSAKGHFGNLGAGSGLVECAASVLALQRGELFPLMNYQTPDAECPVRAARRGDPAGDVFVSSAATPQGQAGSVAIRRWNG